ncbi:SDR family oxidoreductase [Cryptosporangium arvum]|uniref:SDR family oxidoreductase n=1 Tax=Cryptosporangium arvum TaxID=80871 RepID=UPI0004B73AC9|nr:SDR family oxidoreductase [Cryptosporangium arvum]
MGRCAGKIVVVTGAARGQGAAGAAALAEAGATVIATDVLPPAEPTPPGGVVFRALDVTSPDGWAALAAEVGDVYGRVDGLVSNAGIASRDRLPDVPLDAWHRALDVNATGPLLGIQALAPLMAPGSSRSRSTAA